MLKVKNNSKNFSRREDGILSFSATPLSFATGLLSLGLDGRKGSKGQHHNANGTSANRLCRIHSTNIKYSLEKIYT